MHMEPAAQVEGGVPGMSVLIDNRPRHARAGAARKRAAPSPWLSAGGNHDLVIQSQNFMALRHHISSLRNYCGGPLR